MLKTSNILKTFLAILSVQFLVTFISYQLWGFEKTLLLIICISVSLIAMAFAGLENVIIESKEELKSKLNKKD